MLLQVFSGVMIPILAVVGAGYLLRLATDFDLRPLSRVSLYLLSPALIFSSLVEERIAPGQTVRVVAFSVLLVAVMAGLTLAVGGALRFSRKTNTALMLCTMFNNTGNYGLPLALFAFGQRGFEGAILFFIVQAILAQTLGIYLASSGQSGWREGIATLLKIPQLYAVAAALALRAVGPDLVTRGESLAANLYRGISLMGDATIPLLLILLGAALARAEVDTEDAPAISVAVVIRLFAAIPISYGLARLIGLDELSTKLAVVLGSMPTAVNVSLLALEFDLRPRLVGSVVIVSTALSLVTLTVLLGALGAGE